MTKDIKLPMDTILKEQFKAKFCVSSVSVGLFYIFFVLASLFFSPGFFYKISSEVNNILVSIVLFVMMILFLSRQFRYLENVVHFGSQGNLSKYKKVKDTLINVLAAYPVIQNVKKYRLFHNRNPGYFGTSNDPCKVRIEKLDVDSKGYENPKKLGNSIFSNFYTYLFCYYKEIGTHLGTFALLCIWHCIFAGLIFLFFGWPITCIYFYSTLTSILLGLPVIRLTAEVSEHNYESHQTELFCTFNHLSLLDQLFIHPAGDAYHLVHHLYPSVPWWLQSKAHQFLYAQDPSYRTANNRTNFMQKIHPYKALKI